jgi:hypothetical protein
VLQCKHARAFRLVFDVNPGIKAARFTIERCVDISHGRLDLTRPTSANLDSGIVAPASGDGPQTDPSQIENMFGFKTHPFQVIGFQSARKTRQQHADGFGLAHTLTRMTCAQIVVEGAPEGDAQAPPSCQRFALAHRFADMHELRCAAEQSRYIKRLAIGPSERQALDDAAFDRRLERLWPREIAIEGLGQNVERAAGQQDQRWTVARGKFGGGRARCRLRLIRLRHQSP